MKNFLSVFIGLFLMGNLFALFIGMITIMLNHGTFWNGFGVGWLIFCVVVVISIILTYIMTKITNHM